MALCEKQMSEEEAKELESSGFEKLEEGELTDVSGGYVCANVSKQCFEVIDDKTGEVLASGYLTPFAAMSAAANRDQSTKFIAPEYAEELRQKYADSQK